MDFNTIALLFIAFSVISSLVNKWQTRQKQAERESRGPVSEPAVPEVDLSDWDVYEDAVEEPVPPRHLGEDPVGRKPLESVREEEFRQADVRRPVTESNERPEYREVRGARHVTETDRVEFRDPLAVKDEAVEASAVDLSPILSRRRPRTVLAVAKRKRRKKKLIFDRKAMVDAVIYQEILGPPRGEEMPW